MRRLSKLFLAGMMALTASSAYAAPLFTDPLTDLGNGNWAINGSGAIVAAPGGGSALHFNNLGSGGDLFSNIIGGTGAGQYRITVDYYCATSGCGGYLGLHPGVSTTTDPASGDAWLATDTPGAYPTPFLLPNTGGWATATFDFSVTTTGGFGLKLEDFGPGVSGASAGDAYFRNLTISAVPEPATWAMMVGGFGAIGFGLRRRRRQAVRVTYA